MMRSTELKQMNFMNDPGERKRAREALIRLDESKRPTSQNSSEALEIKEQEERANDTTIAAIIAADVEVKETKTSIPLKPTKSALDQKIIIAANENKSFSFFNKLPKAILENYLLPHLDLEKNPKTNHALACTSTSGTLFRQHLIVPELKQFLQAVVFGQKDKVEKTLTASSLSTRQLLLTIPLEVIDYSGRTIYGTALQLALGALDISRLKHPDEGIVEIILKFIETLPNGNFLRREQIQQQFPPGWLEEEHKQIEKNFTALRKVFEAIADSKNGDTCEAAIAEFREFLKPKMVIKSGRHFYDDILCEAFHLYRENFDRFGGLNSHKNLLCLFKIIGHLEQYLPACDAQAFCQGLENLNDRHEKLNRFFNLLWPRHANFSYDMTVDKIIPISVSGEQSSSTSSFTINQVWWHYATYLRQKKERCWDLIMQQEKKPEKNSSSCTIL